MKAELKKKWVSALRSGKYKQGYGCLKSNGKHCCLGVLAELLPGVKWGKKGYEPGRMCIIGDTRDSEFLPDDTKVLDSSIQCELSSMNDDSDCNFDEIADWIERKVPTDG